MAGTKLTKGMNDVMTAYGAWCVDLPLAGTRWSMGLGSRQETTEAAWGGYDATVRLTTSAIDTLYRTPLFGAWTARTLDGVLRWQQVGNAMTRTLLAGLVQAAGLPTQTDTQAVRAEVAALHAELQYRQGAPADTRVVDPGVRPDTVVTPFGSPQATRRAA